MLGLVGILLFVAVLVFIGYREFKQSNQKMESGEDKKKIQNIVNLCKRYDRVQLVLRNWI
uniref:hypothetical protein n=1 Tax=Acetatifactor sp. TaxID=1872090 RepID=UPI0040568A9A